MVHTITLVQRFGDLPQTMSLSTWDNDIEKQATSTM
jgi:hypothetical protein